MHSYNTMIKKKKKIQYVKGHGLLIAFGVKNLQCGY